MEVLVDELNWQVLCKLKCNSMGPDDLRQALNEHLEIVGSISELLKKHKKAETYGLLRVEVEMEYKVLQEDEFFKVVSDHRELLAISAFYVRGIIEHIKKGNHPLWAKEDSPLGLFAVYRIALKDVEYVDLYSDFLIVSDMSHEVYQSEQIKGLLAAHGFGDQIVRLLATRGSVNKGQHGDEDLDELCDRIKGFFRNNPEALKHFLNVGKNAYLELYAQPGYKRMGFDMSYLTELINCVPEEAEIESWRERVKQELNAMGCSVTDENEPKVERKRGVAEEDTLIYEKNPTATADWRTLDLSSAMKKKGGYFLGCDVGAEGETNGIRSSIKFEFRADREVKKLCAEAGSDGTRNHEETMFAVKEDQLEYRYKIVYSGSPDDKVDFGFVDFHAVVEKKRAALKQAGDR